MHERLKRLLGDIDFLSVLFVSMATVATTWCALEATIWSGIQNFRLARAGEASREAHFVQNEANQLRLLSSLIYYDLAHARARGEEKEIEFFLSYLPEGSRDSLPIWFAPGRKRGIKNIALIRDSSVFVKEQEANDLHVESQNALIAASKANRTGDTYIMVTVLLAGSLFCSGVGTKARSPAVQRYFIYAAATILAICLLLLATLPVSFGEPV